MEFKKQDYRSFVAGRYAKSRAQPVKVAISKPVPGLNPIQKKQVKRLAERKEELKYFLTNQALADISNAGTILDLTLVPQGQTDTTRVGDQLTLCGTLELRGTLQSQVNTVTSQRSLCRTIIFQWKSNTVPVVADILLVGPSGATDVYSHYNHDQRQMYTVLHDSIHKLVGNGAAGLAWNPDVHKILYIKVPLYGKKGAKTLQYAGATTAGTNHVYSLFISTEPGGAGCPDMFYQSKVFFRDA